MTFSSRISMGFLIPFGFAIVSALAPAQSLADECTGASCEGKDPLLMGCSADAYYLDMGEVHDLTKPEGETLIGTMTLYYSPTCDAKWSTLMGLSELPSTIASAVLDDGAGGLFGANSRTVTFLGGVYVRSFMSSGSRTVAACAKLEYPDVGRSGQGCTGAY